MRINIYLKKLLLAELGWPSPAAPSPTSSRRPDPARLRRRLDVRAAAELSPPPLPLLHATSPLPSYKCPPRPRFPQSPSGQSPRRRRRISPPPEAVAAALVAVDRRRRHHCNRRSTPPLPVLFAASRDARSRSSGRDRSCRRRPPRLRRSPW